MLVTAIRADGTLLLGLEAAAVGFVPGAVVTLVVLSTGSVLVRLDDAPPPLDADWAPLEGGQAQRALRRAREHA